MRKFFPIILIVIALSARLLPGPRTIDDSYITFRYSQNILAGNGFTYNSGEHVLGTTTPLYTLILTAVGSIFGGVQAPFPIISWLLNSILDAVSCLILFIIGKKVATYRIAIIASLTWAIAPFSVTFSIGGLETSLFVLLLLFTAFFYLSEQASGMWLCASFLILTRPDALIFILPLVLIGLVTKMKYGLFRIIPITIGLLPLMAWIVFSIIYFGSPIPNSLMAKSVAYFLPENAALIRFIQHYLTPFNEQYTLLPKALYVGLISLPIFYVLGSLSIFRKNPATVPILIYPLLYFVTFSLAHPLIFRWYLTPPLPFYYLIIFAGMENLLMRFIQIAKKFLDRTFPGDSFQPRFNLEKAFETIITLFLMLPLFLTMNAWVIKLDHGNATPTPEMAWVKLEEIYRKTSFDVLEYTYPDDLIAAGDVGVLGYFTGRRILDTVGLNSPIASSYYPLPEDAYAINYAIPTQLILDQKPEMVIFLEIYGRNTLLKSPDFLSQYQLLKEYPTTLYGSDGMLLYQKID